MTYIKFIILKIDDLQSSIIREENYAWEELDNVLKLKREIEKQGYYCLILKNKYKYILKLVGENG